MRNREMHFLWSLFSKLDSEYSNVEWVALAFILQAYHISLGFESTGSENVLYKYEPHYPSHFLQALIYSLLFCLFCHERGIMTACIHGKLYPPV
jgi:hypothetical protein